MSETNYTLDRWLTILAVAIAVYAIGNLIGMFTAYDKCGDRLDYLQEMCLMTSNDMLQVCEKGMEAVTEQCLQARDPTVQQGRINKWEDCFADENCRNCLLQTMEGGNSGTGDVEFCYANALHNDGMPDEPLPDYVPPPEYEPPVQGPQL